MRILITNDDGVFAPGIAALARGLSARLGEGLLKLGKSLAQFAEPMIAQHGNMDSACTLKNLPDLDAIAHVRNGAL